MKNKKKICIFVTFILCIFLIQANSGFAANTPVFSLKADARDAGKDGQSIVTLHVENAQDIRGFEAVVSYDPAMVQFTQEGSAAVHTGFSVKPKVERDKVSVAFACMGGSDSIGGNTDLYRLKFTVKRTGTAVFVLKSVKVVDSAGVAKEYALDSKVSVPCKASKKDAKDEDEVIRRAEELIEGIKNADSLEEAEEALEAVANYISETKDASGLTGRVRRTIEGKVVNAFSDLVRDKTAQTVEAVVSGSKASVHIDSKKANEIIGSMDEAVRLAEEINMKLYEADIGMKLEKKITIHVDSGGDITAVKVQLPAGILAAATQKDIDRVEIKTDTASFALPPDFIKNGGSTSNIAIEANQVMLGDSEKQMLSESQRRLLEDQGTVYDFNLTADGQPVLSFRKKITIRLKYDLKAGEDRDHITVLYLADDGTVKNMAGKWDEETGEVVLETNHFSKYMVKNVAASFPDAGGTFWGRTYIESMASKGVVNGRPNGSFDPDGKVTRAEFAKMIATAMGIVNDSAQCTFSDISKPQWHYKYVASAVNAGIIKGKANNLFAPDDNITRQEMGVMIYRALGEAPQGNPDILFDFNDQGDIADWATDAMGAVVDAGIMNGKPGNFLDPNGCLTRAEAAAVIYRFFNY